MVWHREEVLVTTPDLLCQEQTYQNTAMTATTQKEESISHSTKSTKENIKKLSQYFSKQKQKNERTK